MLPSLSEYAQVIKMLGNGRLEALCFDGVKRLCHIRGKLRKKVILKHCNREQWHYAWYVIVNIYVYSSLQKLIFLLYLIPCIACTKPGSLWLLHEACSWRAAFRHVYFRGDIFFVCLWNTNFSYSRKLYIWNVKKLPNCRWGTWWLFGKSACSIWD